MPRCSQDRGRAESHWTDVHHRPDCANEPTDVEASVIPDWVEEDSDWRHTGSNDNAFIAPWDAEHISAEGELSLAQWQAQTGMDGSSFEAWFSQAPGETPRTELFVNDSAQQQSVPLGSSYVDLQQNAVPSPLVLPRIAPWC